MYITDKNTYCWTTDDSCGEPQRSVRDAIEDFYEDDYDNLDCSTVLIGHPSYYIPDMFNAEQLIWDMNDKIEEDYDIALNDELTVDQDMELEERLPNGTTILVEKPVLYDGIETTPPTETRTTTVENITTSFLTEEPLIETTSGTFLKEWFMLQGEE